MANVFPDVKYNSGMEFFLFCFLLENLLEKYFPAQ